MTKPKPATAMPVPSAPSQTTQGLAAGAAPTEGAGNEVVARVGTANVSAAEIRTYMATLAPGDREALKKTPGLLSQAVRGLLANRLVLQELRSKKWDQQPNVTAQLERLREGALVELYLQTVSAPPAGFPSDEELQKVYDANREALLMPRQFQIAQIFIPARAGDKAAEAEARKRLDEVQRKLKAPGADFAAVAAEEGTKNSGDLGWLAEGSLRPEIRAQVAGLAKNTISEPVRLDDGWHVLKLIDTKAAYTRTLPEVREQLIEQMRAERARTARQAYLADLLKQNPPVLNELAVWNLLEDRSAPGR
ncbi:MAG TPA: peptidyl-prolyl cis-trans isomerase [Bradyrhizobium sp.]|nr:peptidyl-prolyl cis-trans isomerase [Bradyrhizobium sp.]